MSRRVESWGRVPAARHEAIIPLQSSDDSLPLTPGRSVLPYGLGRSYGDVCLNDGGTLLETTPLNRPLAFDRERGILRAEAGMSLADVLALVVPAGWFLPVTPGTRFVTLGGAIANDVHGKNHHRDGTFGRFVRRLELWRSDGSRTECSPDHREDLYSATIGGLGLTGLIRWAEIQLIPISSDRIAMRSTRLESLADFFDLNEEACGRSQYTVAWLDTTAPGHALGRGIYMEGIHAPGTLPPPSPTVSPRLTVPVDAPSWLLNRFTTRAFNALYWRRQLREVSEAEVHYAPFFYPLDALGAWNRLYGRRGFYQYQFVAPLTDGELVVREVIQSIHSSGEASPLAVLKTFGDVASPGMLSFPTPGVTLALDFPNRGDRTRKLFAELDAIVRTAGGRLYPAKDAWMSEEDFKRSYPRWSEFRDLADPVFSSSFARRVGILHGD